MEQGEQLEMNFTGGGNRFRDYLDHGIFLTLFEHAVPPPETPETAALDRLKQLEHTVVNLPIPAALALTEGAVAPAKYRAVDYAAHLAPQTRGRHVIYLSGKDTDFDRMKSLIGAARSSGLVNVVPVSGNANPGEPVRSVRRHTFTESIETLHYLSTRTDAGAFFPGGTVNPFIYQAPGILAQFFKAVKKLNFGAQFLVTQAGFDLAQLQALRWFLSWRGLFFPTLARLLLLTPRRVELIRDGRMPGIRLSEDFQQMLNRELRFSPAQFEAAQYRRLELQAAGCRFLGYSGVQIAGAETPEQIGVIARKIAQALEEFPNFESWLEEYRFYLARTDMAPEADRFYLFERLLRSADCRDEPRFNDYALPEPGRWEECRRKLAAFCFPEAHRQDPADRRLLKRLLAGCPGCGNCRLPQTGFVCVERCPKRLANGPCGGIRPDGACEITGTPCLHNRILLEAERTATCDRLETVYVPSGRGDRRS